jgi:hypothetical protein
MGGRGYDGGPLTRAAQALYDTRITAEEADPTRCPVVVAGERCVRNSAPGDDHRGHVGAAGWHGMSDAQVGMYAPAVARRILADRAAQKAAGAERCTDCGDVATFVTPFAIPGQCVSCYRRDEGKAAGAGSETPDRSVPAGITLVPAVPCCSASPHVGMLCEPVMAFGPDGQITTALKGVNDWRDTSERKPSTLDARIAEARQTVAGHRLFVALCTPDEPSERPLTASVRPWGCVSDGRVA